MLATLLINHTGEIGINSSYYPIYYVPIVTAALHFGAWGTLLWTLLASAAYCSYLYPALQEYELTPEGAAQLAIRILFFFLAAMVVNRFTLENRRQTAKYPAGGRAADQYQSRAGTGPGGGPAFRAAGRPGTSFRRAGARNPQPAGRDQRIGGDASSESWRASNPLASELAGYISSEVNRASALVTRFLDFARPLRTETRPVQVTALLDQALNSVAGQWKGGTVAVRTRISEGFAFGAAGREALRAGVSESGAECV